LQTSRLRSRERGAVQLARPIYDHGPFGRGQREQQHQVRERPADRSSLRLVPASREEQSGRRSSGFSGPFAPASPASCPVSSREVDQEFARLGLEPGSERETAVQKNLEAVLKAAKRARRRSGAARVPAGRLGRRYGRSKRVLGARQRRGNCPAGTAMRRRRCSRWGCGRLRSTRAPGVYDRAALVV
jgi:hypothetical protein